MGGHVELTFKEERLLRALYKAIKMGHRNPVAAAADELRIARHTVYTTLYRIRRRYMDALHFGEEYRKWRKKLGDRYL